MNRGAVHRAEVFGGQPKQHAERSQPPCDKRRELIRWRESCGAGFPVFPILMPRPVLSVGYHKGPIFM